MSGLTITYSRACAAWRFRQDRQRRGDGHSSWSALDQGQDAPWRGSNHSQRRRDVGRDDELHAVSPIRMACSFRHRSRSDMTPLGVRCMRCCCSPPSERQAFARSRSRSFDRPRCRTSTCSTHCSSALEQPHTRAVVFDALHANILDAFNEFGVQITSPNYEADPEGRARSCRATSGMPRRRKRHLGVSERSRARSQRNRASHVHS